MEMNVVAVIEMIKLAKEIKNLDVRLLLSFSAKYCCACLLEVYIKFFFKFFLSNNAA